MIRLFVVLLAALAVTSVAGAVNENSEVLVDRIWVVGADGRGLRQVSSGDADHSPAVSPNGRLILFVRGERYWEGDDIWVMEASGRNERQLTNTPEGDYDPQI